MNRFMMAAVVLAAGLALAPSARSAGVTVALTADTEGHVNPCNQCPHGAGDGGLARRATAVAALRGPGPLLLVDAGNALFGPDSLDSGGAVIADAYDRLGYDAVNVSFRDFRLGKDTTLQLFERRRFAAVSANLLDAATGQSLVKPYVVKEIAGRRVAVIGLSEPPAGMDYLPHLKRQLAGVKIVPPAEALTRWLPKAKAEADDVVLLYYGPAGGAKKIADAFGKDLAAILVGGARPEELPRETAVPLAATAEHGKSLARLTLGAKGPAEQIAVNDSVAADPKMAALLAEGAPPAVADADPTPAADAGAGDTADGGVRKLVRVEVPPIEPAPAESGPPPSEPAASTPAPSETAAVEPADAAKQSPAPTASPARSSSGVLNFLKSLVGGADKSAKAPAATKTTSVESQKPQQAEQPQRTPASTGPKFCTNCGAKLTPNAKFCTHCGTRVRR